MSLPDTATPPNVLYYAPLLSDERFVVQQVRDLPSVTVATLETAPKIAELGDTEVRSIAHPQGIELVDRVLRKVARKIGGHSGRRAPLELAHLAYLCRKSDLVYSLFSYNAMDLLAPARIAKRPLVVHVGGSDITTAESRGPAYMRQLHALWQQAELILCGSEFLLAEALARDAPAAKCEVHYLGVDLPAGPALKRPSRDGPIRVTAISRLHPVKGVDRSIRAFATAFEGVPAQMRILGGGPLLDELVELAKALGIQDRIEFMGHQPHDVVSKTLTETDIFIQHNVVTDAGGAEGLGGTVLEASAHQVPVVVTDSGGIVEGIIEGTTGFAVAEEDIGAMASRMQQLASDPDLRSAMGRAGRSYVAQHHNAATQTTKLADRLRWMIKNSAGDI